MMISTSLYSKDFGIFMFSLSRKSSVSYRDIKIVVAIAAAVQAAMISEEEKINFKLEWDLRETWLSGTLESLTWLTEQSLEQIEDLKMTW